LHRPQHVEANNLLDIQIGEVMTEDEKKNFKKLVERISNIPDPRDEDGTAWVVGPPNFIKDARKFFEETLDLKSNETSSYK